MFHLCSVKFNLEFVNPATARCEESASPPDSAFLTPAKPMDKRHRRPGRHGEKTGVHADIAVSKFKTKVCLYYLQPTGCPYGERCLFSHSVSEMREDTTGTAPGTVSVISYTFNCMLVGSRELTESGIARNA